MSPAFFISAQSSTVSLQWLHEYTLWWSYRTLTLRWSEADGG